MTFLKLKISKKKILIVKVSKCDYVSETIKFLKIHIKEIKVIEKRKSVIFKGDQPKLMISLFMFLTEEVLNEEMEVDWLYDELGYMIKRPRKMNKRDIQRARKRTFPDFLVLNEIDTELVIKELERKGKLKKKDDQNGKD